MSETPLIVGVSGSRRDDSHTLKTLQYALDAAEAAGAETNLIDLGSVDLPLYHPDKNASEQGEAADLLALVREADGVLLGSPVYHSSYSSTFRNFHDYCGFDEFENTAVGLVVVAGGGTIASTLDHMRVTVRGVHGHVVPEQVGIRNASNQFEDGELVGEDIADRLDDLAEAVVEEARYRSGAADSAEVPTNADD